VANYNSPTQVVITGETKPVQRATQLAEARGAKRTIPLNVAGPWHSMLMNDARETFSADLDAAEIHDPEIPVYANIDAAPKATGEEVREALKEQITSPVRWAQTVLELRKEFPNMPFIECGPGRVLKGLMRGIDKAAVCVNVECPKSLDACLEKLRG
ncbi:MAG: ACP S-malonyltransferase, partial [Planctomycetota bacterium]